MLHFGVAGATDAARRRRSIATSGSDLPDRVNAARIVKLDSRAETHVSRAKFLSTGDMKYVDNYDQIGLEAGGRVRSGDLPGASTRRRRSTAPTTTRRDRRRPRLRRLLRLGDLVHHRRDPPVLGVRGRVRPRHPEAQGAALWKSALRYSTIDLNDMTAVDPIKGGSAKNITLGVTWYINANHKIMFNVTHGRQRRVREAGQGLGADSSGHQHGAGRRCTATTSRRSRSATRSRSERRVRSHDRHRQHDQNHEHRVPVSIPRWQWRTFAADLSWLTRRFRRLAQGDPSRRVDEIHLVCLQSSHHAFLRGDTLELRWRKEVGPEGFELWDTILQCDLPFRRRTV